MKVFLAMPYSQLCDKNYEVKLEYKCFFTKLIEELKKINCEYFWRMKEKNGEKIIVLPKKVH